MFCLLLIQEILEVRIRKEFAQMDRIQQEVTNAHTSIFDSAHFLILKLLILEESGCANFIIAPTFMFSPF